MKRIIASLIMRVPPGAKPVPILFPIESLCNRLRGRKPFAVFRRDGGGRM
jgi:hypothetical protein